MHWLAQGLRKVQVEPGFTMATQNFKRNLFLNLYREGKKKKSNTCSFPPATWERKNVWHLKPISSIWRPLAFLHPLSPIPGQKDPLEKEMATYSSILAWRILWTEESGGLQSMGLQRVRQDWADAFTFSLSKEIQGGLTPTPPTHLEAWADRQWGDTGWPLLCISPLFCVNKGG